MHILFLSDNFPPEVNAPASRTFEHCREWVALGHRVTVITTAPNFPAGKLIGGYRNRLHVRETIEGIEVVRVWSYITANEGFLKRTLDYVSFAASGFLAALFVKKPDVIVATSPQFFTACAGWATGFFRRRPYVFELRDLWPESIRAVGAVKNDTALNLLERLELFLYRHAALVVSVTNAFKRDLVERGIPPGRVEVITNGADLSRYQPRPKDAALVEQLGLEGKFVAGYIGTHGMAHALGTILDAAETLQTRGDASVHFLLVGDGADKAALEAEAKRRELGNVSFVGTVSKDAVVRYWSVLDASIIHLRDTPLFRTVIPSKIFECMAMGIPIILGVEGEAADIVRGQNAGVVVPPENAGAIVDTIVRMRDDARYRGDFAEQAIAGAQRFDRAVLARQLLDLLLGVARR